MPRNPVQVIRRFLSDVDLFSRIVVRRPLRSYQLAPAKAIIESVLCKRGDTFAVVMSRQAGKNELSAQLEAYLMNLFQQVRGASIVKAAPTFKPQTVNSQMRLRDCLDSAWNKDSLHGDGGYIVRLGRCRILFFSAQPTANVVGATASVLLECDEAQDVDADKWSKDFAPMASSTNATTVFYGTIWTSRTLLAQVIRDLLRREAADGRQRVFSVPWQVVAAEVPAYGEYVQKEIARLGPEHPIIRTQYKLEEIDEAGRLFSAERQARMKGEHRRERLASPKARSAGASDSGLEAVATVGSWRLASPLRQPRQERGAQWRKRGAQQQRARGAVVSNSGLEAIATVGGRQLAGQVYVMTVDVAGEDEQLEGEELRVEQPRKDSTVATVFRVDMSTVEDPLIGFPTYHVVNRYWWTGVKHSALYATLASLVREWRAWYLVVDATGVGAGLASFLVKKLGRAVSSGQLASPRARGAVATVGGKDLGGIVVPFEFSSQSKSDLGWSFVGLVESGRYKDYAEDGEPDTAQFWREVAACEFEVMPGPGKVLRWGVADAAEHDDMLVSAALVSVLDGMDWRVEVEGEVIPADDALDAPVEARAKQAY